MRSRTELHRWLIRHNGATIRHLVRVNCMWASETVETSGLQNTLLLAAVNIQLSSQCTKRLLDTSLTCSTTFILFNTVSISDSHQRSSPSVSLALLSSCVPRAPLPSIQSAGTFRLSPPSTHLSSAPLIYPCSCQAFPAHFLTWGFIYHVSPADTSPAHYPAHSDSFLTKL